MATLNDVITDPAKRRPVYRAFAALGILIGAIQVGFAAAEAGQPVWLTVILAVYAFLAGSGFLVAQAHTETVVPDGDSAAQFLANIGGDAPEPPSPRHAKRD